jgi:hypothetical protein
MQATLVVCYEVKIAELLIAADGYIRPVPGSRWRKPILSRSDGAANLTYVFEDTVAA